MYGFRICLHNQAAELLTALQHVERSEPEWAQTIAVIEQLFRLVSRQPIH